jgi:hypothetical protein
MTNNNKISAVLTDANRDAAIAAIKQAQSTLTFLINLTIDDRKALRKMGSKSVDYVNLALQGAQNFGSLLPASFNVTEFSNDVALVNQLKAVQIVIASLNEGINDTLLAAASDAMMSADTVYGYLKTGAKNNAGVKTLVDEIGKRFEGQGKKSAAAVVSEAKPA